jgi:hypothetical protein
VPASQALHQVYRQSCVAAVLLVALATRLCSTGTLLVNDVPLKLLAWHWKLIGVPYRIGGEPTVLTVPAGVKMLGSLLLTDVDGVVTIFFLS